MVSHCSNNSLFGQKLSLNSSNPEAMEKPEKPEKLRDSILISQILCCDAGSFPWSEISEEKLDIKREGNPLLHFNINSKVMH